MTFGDPGEFAIEAYHEPSGPKWAGCGRMCLHLQGVSLGDVRENHCSMFHPTDRLREVASEYKSLWADEFASMSDKEVFELVDREIYSDQASIAGRSYWAYDFLTGTSEMFDCVQTVVIFRPPDRIHIMYRRNREADASVNSGSCSVQTFRKVVDDYIKWFDEQVRTTAPPYFPINPFDLNERVPDDLND